jgi:integrase
MAGKKNRRGWGWVAKQRSGRYLASYIGRDLLRHYAGATFTSKLDAEAWLASERRLIELGTWTPPTQREAQKRAATVTLDIYAQTWIDQRPIKPRTRSMYKDLMRLHISPQLGKVPIGALSGQAVRAWYARLGTEHKRRNSHAYGLLHSICATAVKDGLLPTNPCQIERAMNPPRQREPVILTPDEIAKVANEIQPAQLKALVLISAWGGLRWGEVTELRRKDISADCSVVNVSRAVTHRNGCDISTPKSGKGRSVYLPPHIQGEIRDHLAQHVGSDPDALLFTATRSCHYSERMMRDALAAALKSVGIDRQIRIHDMRHFAGSQTARVANLVETQARLGHSTVKASMLYQHMVSGRDREVAAALSELAQNPG